MSTQALINAIKSENLIEVINRVEQGADVNGVVGDDTPLTLACKLGFDQIVSYLIYKGADLEKKPPRNNGPLVFAIGYNKIECVRVLLAAGANPNVITRNNNSLIIICHNADIARLLIKAGFNVNQVNVNKETLLHQSVKYGNSTSITPLIEAGVDIDAVDCEGRTVLHQAVRYHHIDYYHDRSINLDTLQELLKHNPNDRIVDKEGKTPKDYLSTNNNGIDDDLDEQLLIELVTNYQYNDLELKEPDEIYNV